jgi:hypothetical protein
MHKEETLDRLFVIVAISKKIDHMKKVLMVDKEEKDLSRTRQ